MRIRTRMVSNSSSTSFCIYGTVIEKKEEDWEALDALKCSAKQMGLEVINGPPYDYDLYIGRYWSSIKDHETGLDFKLTVEKCLEKLFGHQKECDTYEESWYDG